MPRPEQYFELPLQPDMAKPGIPVEKPRRREFPDIQDPFAPIILPQPSEPVKIPEIAVPSR